MEIYTTIVRSGAKSVLIRTTGHDKGRQIFALSAMMDSRKVEPFDFVVFKCGI